MSHNIFRNAQGVDCFAAVGDRKDVWHQLGQYVVPEDGRKGLTWPEMVKLAGLDWQVSKVQNTAVNPNGQLVKVPTATIFRSSDNAILGQVGPEFAVKQNEECFQFIDTLLEANGGSHFDTAGALENGAKIFCSVRVPKADIEVVSGDKMSSSLIFATAHDGSMAHTVKLAATRPVCANTLSIALSEAGAMFKVKHTKNADARLDRAKDLMMHVAMDAVKLGDKLKALAARKITKESLTSIMERLFPMPKEKDANTTRRDNVLAEVLSLYESNDQNAFPSIRGTAYNLLNAVTEYTDHVRTARITDNRTGYSLNQARAENAVIGSGDVLKSKALDVILEQTNGAPVHVYQTIQRAPVSGKGSLLDDVLANHTN